MSDRNALELTETAGIRFDHLFEANYNAIYRYCARRLGGSDAEDAAADVFAVAWRRLEAMPDGDARTAWLFGVAHRVVGASIEAGNDDPGCPLASSRPQTRTMRTSSLPMTSKISSPHWTG